jgi:hypothetical protein
MNAAAQGRCMAAGTLLHDQQLVTVCSTRITATRSIATALYVSCSALHNCMLIDSQIHIHDKYQ